MNVIIFRHPFSITSAPGDEHLSVHIRTVGDWTQELKRVISEGDHSLSLVHQANFAQLQNMDDRRLCSQPKLFVDGPYGAPAQDYRNYDVLLLVGLGIGATPFVSILKDLLNSTRTAEEQMVQFIISKHNVSLTSSNFLFLVIKLYAFMT